MATPNLPPELADYEDAVNPNWREIEDPKTVKDLNGFIIFRIRNWKAVDGNLEESFNEDFYQIPLTLWREANKDLLQNLKNFLRYRGLLIKTSQQSVAQRLYNCAQAEYDCMSLTYDDWPEDEIERQRQHGGFHPQSRYGRERYQRQYQKRGYSSPELLFGWSPPEVPFVIAPPRKASPLTVPPAVSPATEAAAAIPAVLSSAVLSPVASPPIVSPAATESPAVSSPTVIREAPSLPAASTPAVTSLAASLTAPPAALLPTVLPAAPQAIPPSTATSTNETPAQKEKGHYNRESGQERATTESESKAAQQWKNYQIGLQIDIPALANDFTADLTTGPIIDISSFANGLTTGSTTVMLGVTSFLIITFEPIDDLDEQELRDKDPPVELDELENGQEMDTTMGITEGKGEIEEQWKNREIGCKIDTPSLADNLTTVLTTNLTAGPTIVAPELTVAPEPIIAPALTDTPELTTDVDNQELRAGDTLVELDGQAPTKIGKESPVVTSTGITSKTSSGTTTTKTGIERSRFDAYQRLPEPVSASAFASAPASAICKPGANPNEMSDERGTNDHREDSLWDNHRKDFCQSDFGRWHK